MKYNPFKQNATQNEKESPRDPLDVKELLTNHSKKARITSSGELQLEPLDNEKPAVELMKERYWGSHQRLFNKRLSTETRIMNESFPQFKLHKSAENFYVGKWLIAEKAQLFWLGTLQTHSKKQYLVACVYPCDYPFSEIRSFILQPQIPSTEHRFKDGSLCLYEHNGKGKGYDMKSTAITIIAWTSAWLHAYEIWLKTGKWPTLGDNDG